MEKYDGVKVYWNGKDKLLTPSGKVINVPRNLAVTFPSLPFEGELWCGYNTLQQSLRLAYELRADNSWTDAKVIVFDAPVEQLLSYDERISLLRQSILLVYT
jgi:hypothetical protein